MAEITVSQLTPFDKGKSLDFIENNGEIFFTVEEIGRHLGYKNPRLSIQKLFRVHQNELKHYSVETKTVSTDGKAYETRAFTEEGVYILSMLARTNEAKKFRARVALLLRRVRRERMEQAIEWAREAALAESVQLTEKAAQVVWTLGTKDKRNVRRVVKWYAKGLGLGSIAKLMDINKRMVSHYLKAARLMGLLPAVQPSAPALPEVAYGI